MQSSFKLGRIHGIEIGIHYTWLIVFVLVAVSLALGFFPQIFPGMGLVTIWAVSIVASALLFASVLIHELAHSFVAQSKGIEVQGITLFIFGGVSNLSGEASTPGAEMLITGAGPAASIGLGVLFTGLFLALRNASEALAAVLFYLAITNFLLAAFNLIPGFPLDGGRLLRAIVWGITHNFRKATIIASIIGQGVAYLFIFGGIFLFFTGDFLQGVWLVFIGWFLASAADASRRQVDLQQEFAGLEVSELMNTRPVEVSSYLSLQDLVDEYVLARNLRSMLVVDDGQLVGMITLADISRISRDRWHVSRVSDAMTPAKHLATVSPNTSITQALQIMADQDLNQLPVIRDGQVVGLLSRAHVMRYLQVRQELKRAA